MMLVALSFMNVQGQSHAVDTVVSFKFLGGNDMFFSPFRGNEQEIEKMYRMVDHFRKDIEAGKIPIHVNGYCSYFSTSEENLRVAKIRSNRVKSQMITHKGMKESYFVTKNHATAYGEHASLVIVSIRVPKASIPQEPKQVAPKEEPKAQPARPTQPQTRPAEPVAAQPVQEAPKMVVAPPVTEDQYRFAIRANLLYWVALAPDLGLEWRPTDRFSILVHGTFTDFTWKDGKRIYKGWKVDPEIRYHFGKNYRVYMGLSYHAGEIDFKFTPFRRKGDLQGGSLTGGYQLSVSNRLSFDFNLGLGLTYVSYDKIKYSRNVEQYRTKEKYHMWGVNQAGISLVWKICK